MAIEPVTREETFLAAAGGQSVTPPTPITRKEQLLQGIIDAVQSGGATPDVIEAAVTKYLDANPVQPGATTEQAAQIEQNKADIADLQTEVDELKESGGNGSGQNAGVVVSDTAPEDTSVLWVDTSDETEAEAEYYTKDETDAAITAKLTEAKESGEFDGADGKDGEDGEDGYTPVRGTDYWTDADIAEIKSYVDESILGGAW